MSVVRPEPTHAEHVAFAVVARVLGVQIDATPEQSGPGQVDAHLIYPDGRRAALEVTTVTDPAERALQTRLLADDHVWHVDGLRWQWVVFLAPVDTRTAKPLLGELLRLCEQHEVAAPEWLSPRVRGHRAVGWYRLGGVRVHPQREPIGGGDWSVPGRVYVQAGQARGSVAGDVNAVPAWLTREMVRPLLARKAAKLAMSGLDERHLYVVVDDGGAPFAGYDALAFYDSVPSVDPVLGAAVTHVWLAPRWGRGVLTWSFGRGWKRHEHTD